MFTPLISSYFILNGAQGGDHSSSSSHTQTKERDGSRRDIKLSHYFEVFMFSVQCNYLRIISLTTVTIVRLDTSSK